MKKINSLLFIALLSVISLSASAAALPLVTVHLSAGGNVLTAFNAAAATDSTVIVLDTEGTYLWSTSATVFTPKTVSVVAASGLATRPIIQYTGATATSFFIFYKLGTSSGTLRFDGVEINGNDKITSSLLAVKCDVGYNLNVFLNNCKVKKIASSVTTTGLAPIFTYSNTAGNKNPDSLVITNSIFEASALGTKTTAVLWLSGACRPKNIILKNCYFKGQFEKAIISNVSSAGSEVKSYTIDHCTFDGNANADLSLFNIAGDALSTTAISNCLFVNNTGTTANVLGTGGNLATKCGVFGATNAATVYPTAVTDVAITTDPAINVYGYATTADYAKTASDGKAIGYSPKLKAVVAPASANLAYGATQQYAVTISDSYTAFVPTISSTIWSLVATGTSLIDVSGLLTAGNADEIGVKVNATATTIYGDCVATPALVNITASTGLKNASTQAFTVSQNGSIFNVSGVNNSAYSAYSVNGAQVAAGQIVNGKIQMNLNQGIYLMKVNGQVAKFAVR